MTEHHPVRNANPLNANLVGFILFVNFIIIGGLIFATILPPSPQVSSEAQAIAELVTSTAVPQELEPTSTPTPLPPTVTQKPKPTLTPTPIQPTAALEQPVTTGGNTGDAANGQVLFNTFQPAASFACATCHYADREDQLIGPGLLYVSLRARCAKWIGQ